MKILTSPQSGSYAGMTASRNRNGQYFRTRAIPVNPDSSFQANQRASISARAAEWRALTAIQRAGWTDLGTQMTSTDSLGQAQTMTGSQAYTSVNVNRAKAGDAVVTAAPALVTPAALVMGAITLTAVAFSIAYTPTPLAAGQRCVTFASLQMSAGRAFSGQLRQIQISAAAAATPTDIFTAYQARFGTPVVGNRIFVALVCYASGFHSIRAVGSAIVS